MPFSSRLALLKVEPAYPVQSGGFRSMSLPEAAARPRSPFAGLPFSLVHFSSVLCCAPEPEGGGCRVGRCLYRRPCRPPSEPAEGQQFRTPRNFVSS